MISIDVKKSETKAAEPEMSLSQKKLLREAKEEAAKKMSVEKADRLKRAGIAK